MILCGEIDIQPHTTPQPATTWKKKKWKNLSSLREFRILFHNGTNFMVFIFREGVLFTYISHHYFFFYRLDKL